ncbi:MAG: hypothetical protein U9R68_11340 [Planctomycetota bacterium]|nr:hypothetical protein [Planctomycetota bacterium]
MKARPYLKVDAILLAGLIAVVALGFLDARAAVEQKVGIRGRKGPIKSKGVKAGMKTEALKVELPKAMFEGTPKNIKPTPLLEKYIDKPRPPFLIPEGCTNVAKDKAVASSDSMPIIGELELVTDADKEGTDGSYVELGPGLQWVQIDLKKTCNIYALIFWHYHAEGRVYHDVVMQVSDDADFIEGVKTIYNNDYDNSSGLGIGKDLEFIEDYRGRLIDAGGVKGRYVRMYSAGNTSNDQNHYIEVEVYGKPAK